MDYYSHRQNPRVPTAQKGKNNVPVVRVHFFLLLAICQFTFVSSHWQLLKKVINGKCGGSSVYNYDGHELQYSVVLSVSKNCMPIGFELCSTYSCKGCAFQAALISSVRDSESELRETFFRVTKMNEMKATTRSLGVLSPNNLAGGQGSERNLARDTGYSEENGPPCSQNRFF